MNPKIAHFCLRSTGAIVLGLLLTQCADKAPADNAATEASRPRSMNERFNSRDKQGYAQDSEGNWKIKNNKRSMFENAGRTSFSNKSFKTAEYKPSNVQKKSWWGNRDYESKVFAGNTSANQYRTTAADAAKNAKEGGSRSLFSGKSVDTQRIARTSARESGQSGMKTTEDAETTVRRSVYAEPSIIDYQQQRAIDIQQTRSILGH